MPKNTVGWPQKEKAKLGLQRYDVIGKSTLANLLYKKIQNRHF